MSNVEILSGIVQQIELLRTKLEDQLRRRRVNLTDDLDTIVEISNVKAYLDMTTHRLNSDRDEMDGTHEYHTESDDDTYK